MNNLLPKTRFGQMPSFIAAGARGTRQGSMLVLLLLVMVALLISASFAINKSYLNVAHTDLKTALDLAAKSGAVGIGQFQNKELARAVAEATFYKHSPVVGDDNEKLILVSVLFGNAKKKIDGSVEFNEDGIPVNAIRVVGRYPKMWGGQLLPLSFVGNSSLELQSSSIAARTDNDVCLVIDRSASMAWDLTNEPYSYPDGGSEIQNYFTEPHDDESRWAALVRSIQSFVELAKTEIPGEVRMGMVSYSSDYTFGSHSSEKVTVDRTITANLDSIVDKLQEYGDGPIIGDTDIAAGLNEVLQAYTSAEVRPETGNRIAILFTDGLKTSGDDPVAAAANLYSQNFAVHVISFSAQADQALAAEIATAGHGSHLHADNEAELKAAFKAISESFPGTLIN